MNELAKITVRTPVGPTEEFVVERIVKQGTVYGPQICISSMDKVNILGNDVITFYGPNLELRAAAFVDDVTGLGGVMTANKLVENCNSMEKLKKMTFNNTLGKTEYLVIIADENSVRTVTAEVKKGPIQRVKEHKLPGTWFDESGNFMINIVKRKQKLQFMISTTKSVGSFKNVGYLAVEARFKLGEAVVLPSFLYNAEAFPS